MKIRNKDDLRLSYMILNTYKELIEECKNPEKVSEKIIEQKREIRAFLKKKSSGKIVKDYGIDGYVALIELPEELEKLQEAEEYFEENEVIHARPSMYDCTGQAFTTGFKVFKRRNRFMAYHSVGFDV